MVLVVVAKKNRNGNVCGFYNVGQQGQQCVMVSDSQLVIAWVSEWVCVSVSGYV